MKTPEEIKKGLEACRADECHGHHTGCPYDDDFFCIMHICGDALAHIEQLEERISLNSMRDAIYEDAVAHGLWEEEAGPIECCVLIGDEGEGPIKCYKLISDEVEELGSAAVSWETDYFEDCDDNGFSEELADVIIMSLSVAGKLGIDIDAAVRRKMEINKGRPWKHGKEEKPC